FFFQAEDGIRDFHVTGVQTCALPIFTGSSVLTAGWAIVGTGAMSATLGWVAIVSGIVEILQVFSSSMALMGLGFLLVIVWLVWEIGRASCRERVWVVVGGGAVYVGEV